MLSLLPRVVAVSAVVGVLSFVLFLGLVPAVAL